MSHATRNAMEHLLKCAWPDLTVIFKPFSSYSIHCTCTYAQRSWQRIIISRADRERCKGFRIPVKNSYLLNSLSKIIENNKPQPVPLFRFLGNILYTRICLIFFFKSEPVWPFFVVWGLMWPWRHRTLELLNKTLRPWSGGGGWCVGCWVVVKAKYIYVNFSMDLVPRMSIDRLIG